MSQNPVINPLEPLQFNHNAGGKWKPQHVSAEIVFPIVTVFFPILKSRFLFESFFILKIYSKILTRQQKLGFLGILESKKTIFSKNVCKNLREHMHKYPKFGVQLLKSSSI